MGVPRDGGELVRHQSEHGSWEMLLRPPRRDLLPFVRRYCLYSEATSFQRRQHLPSGDVTLIVNLDGDLVVEGPRDGRRRYLEGEAFLAGLHTSRAVTETDGRQGGVEVSLTPLGTALLLGGLPMHDVTNRVLPLDDLLGAQARALIARLGEAAGSCQRFALLDRFLGERIAERGPRACGGVGYAWSALVESGGRARVGDLAVRLGWSHKRLIAEFRSKIGLAPKQAARVLRFSRCVQLLDAEPELPWAEVALRCGYSDQAHLAREVRSLSGSTPSELARHRLPDSGGLSGG